MTIAEGKQLPDARLLQMGDNGPEWVDLGPKLKGRKVIIFGLPGAFTGVCSTSHVPSFIRTKEAFEAKGVDEIICVAVNDPFVLRAWSDHTGASKAGITTLGDADSSFTTAIGMNFSAAPVGFVNRSKRYSMYVEDGVVKILNQEDSPGSCNISAGETLLETL